MFYLFAGGDYYPCGGVDDFQGVFDTVEDARQAALNLRYYWWHIVDSDMRIVESVDNRCPIALSGEWWETK